MTFENDEREATEEVEADEIILARRLDGFGTVSVDVAQLIERAPSWTVPQRLFDTGLLEPGDLIPMRRAEAEGRNDFEVAGELEADAAAPAEGEN